MPDFLAVSALTRRKRIEVMDPGHGTHPVKALAVYVVATPLLMWGANSIAGSFDLPPWFFPLAVGLWFVGLPIVITTAIVRARGPILFADGPGAQDPDPTPDEQERRERAQLPNAGQTWSGVQSLFTWKNTVSGGVLAMILWVVLATGWILLLRQGTPAPLP